MSNPDGTQPLPAQVIRGDYDGHRRLLWPCGTPGWAVRHIAVRDRHPAIAAKSPGRDLDAWRRLPALVLAAVDELDDARDDFAVVPGGHQLLEAAVVLDVALQDRVQHGVGRQRVLVLLILAQLGRGRLRQHALGYDRPVDRVAVAAEVVDQRLRQ